MLNDLYHNRTHYLVLFLGLFIGLLAFFGFNFLGLPEYRVEAVIGLCFFYFSWGLVHHWLQNDLHIRIVLEYLLVSIIACLLLLSVIWRAQGGIL